LVVSIVVVVLASTMAILKARKDKSEQINGFYVILDLSKFWNQVILFLTIGLIFAFAYVGANPFIYFQF